MRRYPWLTFINLSKVFVAAVNVFVLVLVLIGEYSGTEGVVMGTFVSIGLASAAVEVIVLWRRRRRGEPSSRTP